MNAVLHLTDTLPQIKFKTIIPFAVALALAGAGLVPGFAQSEITTERSYSPWWARDFEFGFFSPIPLTPRFNLNETDKQVLVSTEVPGFESSDINIEVTKDRLFIKGKRAAAEGPSEQVSFERSISLPSEIDPDLAEANLKNGVLKLVLPKSAPEKIAVRKLTIKTN